MEKLTLECKLLCASSAAAAIMVSDKNGQYNPCEGNNQQYSGISYVVDPFVVVAGVDEIEAALVGKTDSEIIISFRGTLPPEPTVPSLLDWMQDLMAIPIPNKYLKGKVHSGFLIATLLLEEGILNAIKQLDPESKLPIYITGHSKGGGVAPIAAMYFNNSGRLNIENVITFAGPNPGDYTFYTDFKSTFPNAIRYENYLDIVPLLPPKPEMVDIIETIPNLPNEFLKLLNDSKSWNYHPVGALRYINYYKNVKAYNEIEADFLLPIRLEEIHEHAKGGLSFLGDAHNEDCWYGYMEGVCQHNVCLLLNEEKKTNMTKIKLTNQNSKDIMTYVTLGATSGCVVDVTKIIFSDKTNITKVSKLMGHFMLKANSSVYLQAPNGEGFNGNISFNTPPMNCKSVELPNGMNVAEFIVNNGFQEGSPQETIDNSCVAGANAKIKFSVDTDDWGTDSGTIKVSEFQNNEWDKNTNVIGVFPYGCDNCTTSVSPPDCVGKQPQFVNTKPICNVQRSAKNNKGGTVEITFIDFI